MGQYFLYIGVQELFKYTNSVNLKFIGQLNNNEWTNVINKSKKADDLADSFLQAIWYLQTNNYINLELNNI